MNYVFSAEHFNWLSDSKGVVKVVLTDGITTVLFDSPVNALAAFNGLDNWDITNYRLIGLSIVVERNF